MWRCICSGFAFATATTVGLVTRYLCTPPILPIIDLDKWWGNDVRPAEEDTSITEFKLEYDEAAITDLKKRIRERRPFTKPLEGIGSEYGMNTIYLDNVLDHWADRYDFKNRLQQFNKFSHFKTNIQGLDLHYVRAKYNFPEGAKKMKTLPLLMLHGWPSSSREFSKVIPLLIQPRKNYDFVFEVIAVDLPGFGFSQGTTKPGLSPVYMAVMMRHLMRRLGFNKFYVQAGDWGSQVATHMATLFQDEILGFHTNMPLSSRNVSHVKFVLGAFCPSLLGEDRKYANRIYPLKDFFAYVIRESGYYHMQATKPDTIGVGLIDSPSGLAAYVLEKMAMCCNRDQLHTSHGGLANINMDDVLDTLTIIWVNNCIVTSMRIYAEGALNVVETNMLQQVPTQVPTAAINFRYEVLYQPDWILRDKFPNLVHSTTVNFGGHFAAIHTPDALVEDIFQATEKFIEFHEGTNVNVYNFDDVDDV